jgi:hypothetical protein
MASDQRYPYDWRRGTADLGRKLNRAHCAVDDLGTALDKGDTDAARSIARSALEAIGRATDAVDTLSAERPPEARLSAADAAGSAIAIDGSEVATVALDVMVNAMVALAATDDEGDTDFLIGACLDAAGAFETGAAVVEAVPGSDGRAILDLKRALDTEAEADLGRRLTDARPRVLEINARIGGND